MLESQKEKFKQCVANTRDIELKYYDIMKISQLNTITNEVSQKKGKILIEKIKSTFDCSKNMENTMEAINDRMGVVLKPYKEKILNGGNILFNQVNIEKFNFYEDLSELSKKCYIIENNIENTNEIINLKEKQLKIDNDQGVWVEREGKKLYVNQNEMNELLCDCYEGLDNLKNMQDEFDNRYENLKNILMKNMGKR